MVLTYGFNISSDKINSIDIDGISLEFIEGGKDTLFLIKILLTNYPENKFIMKIYNYRLKELITHLLSVEKFDELIPQSFDITQRGIDEKLTVKLLPLLIYLMGFLYHKDVKHYFVIQEYSENDDYIIFIRKLGTRINVLKRSWKFLQKNGFVVDFHPRNFKGLIVDDYVKIEYMDYLFFNSNDIKTHSQKLLNDIQNNEFKSEFIFIVPRN